MKTLAEATHEVAEQLVKNCINEYDSKGELLLPKPSAFDSVREDLLIIQPYGNTRFGAHEGMAIEVIHRFCNGPIFFDLDEVDPPMSRYRCTTCTYGYSWEARDVLKWDDFNLGLSFYTILREKGNQDSREWPSKIELVKNKGKAYLSLRKVSLMDIMLSRAKRIVAIRGSL